MDQGRKSEVEWTNACIRLHANLEKLAQIKSNTALAPRIAKTLGRDAISTGRANVIATSYLSGLVVELSNIREMMRDQDKLRPPQWEAPIAELHVALEHFLSNPGQSATALQLLTPQLIQHFYFWGTLLFERDEPELSMPELQSLQKCLTELRAAVLSECTPAQLRIVLQDLIDQFNSALVSYIARGGRALSDVVLAAMEQMRRKESVLREHKDDPAISLLVTYWEALIKVTAPLRDGAALLAVYDQGADIWKKLPFLQ